jgi:hypothetical protein
MGFFTILKARWRAACNPDLNFEAKWNVTVSENEVSCTRPNGKVESLKWDDLEVVAVETTNEGPFVADVFWYLAGETSGCVVPLGATGEDAMLKRLQTLPGFDNETLSKAMASTSNQRFILWRKNDAT